MKLAWAYSYHILRVKLMQFSLRNGKQKFLSNPLNDKTSLKEQYNSL